MGGSIWVASKVNEGSTFHFTVTVDARATPADGVAATVPEALRGLRVLVTEDNETNADLLSALLARCHLRPEVAKTPTQALTLMRQNARADAPYDMALIDAGMDGFQLARQAEAEGLARRALILMLKSTDVGSAQELLRGLSQAAAYVVKPVTQGNLMNAIERATGHSRQAAPIAPVTKDGEIRPLRVLVAEDNLVNQKLLKILLEKNGHTIVVARDGAEAIEAYLRKALDVILMDVQMPVMDGYEATRAIRKIESGTDRHIPVIALTAHALNGDRDLCLNAGMDDYLTKPVDVQELRSALLRWSDDRARAEPLPARAGLEPGAKGSSTDSCLISGQSDLSNRDGCK
jgi:CheY-like chemotaxis protein